MAAHTCTLVPRRASGSADPPTRLTGVSTEGGDALAAAVADLLDEAQRDLRWDAVAAVQEGIVDVGSFLELRVSPWLLMPALVTAVCSDTMFTCSTT